MVEVRVGYAGLSRVEGAHGVGRRVMEVEVAQDQSGEGQINK